MTNKAYLMNLKRDRPIINFLGEICWGFHVSDFEIGVIPKWIQKLDFLLRQFRRNLSILSDLILLILDHLRSANFESFRVAQNQLLNPFRYREVVVERLLKRLISEEKAGAIDLYLNASDVEIIKKALVAVEKEVDDWEFEARIGVSLDEVKKNPNFLCLAPPKLD